MVIETLEQKKQAEGRSWTLIQGDAFKMHEYFETESLDSVIFCSILHEIYSYVEYQGKQFQIESVRDVLRAAWECLVPEGRLVIRDGIAPADDERIIEFVEADGREFFDNFVEQFQGRDIVFDDVATESEAEA